MSLPVTSATPKTAHNPLLSFNVFKMPCPSPYTSVPIDNLAKTHIMSQLSQDSLGCRRRRANDQGDKDSHSRSFGLDADRYPGRGYYGN